MDECNCAEREWPINPVRECSQCHRWIEFESIDDFLEWSSTMRVDRREHEYQCFADAAE